MEWVRASCHSTDLVRRGRGGPRDWEQPSAPCAPSTWGGPVPRFLAMMDTQWGVSAWSASTGTGRHRGGPFSETDRKE